MVQKILNKCIAKDTAKYSVKFIEKYTANEKFVKYNLYYTVNCFAEYTVNV